MDEPATKASIGKWCPVWSGLVLIGPKVHALGNELPLAIHYPLRRKSNQTAEQGRERGTDKGRSAATANGNGNGNEIRGRP